MHNREDTAENKMLVKTVKLKLSNEEDLIITRYLYAANVNNT